MDMKPITISRRFKFLNKLLQQATQQNVILQSADGEQFVLARITNATTLDVDPQQVQAFTVGESDDFDEEVAVTRLNTALMAFLDERATQAKPGSNRSLEAVRQRLGG